MPPIRFRIRTVMIVVAALAVLIATARILAVRSRVLSAWATIEGANVKVTIERASPVSGDIFPPGRPLYFIKDEYILIPVTNFAVLALGIVAVLAFAYCCGPNRRRSWHALDDAEPRESCESKSQTALKGGGRESAGQEWDGKPSTADARAANWRRLTLRNNIPPCSVA
jgi:hypothetical protein